MSDGCVSGCHMPPSAIRQESANSVQGFTTSSTAAEMLLLSIAEAYTAGMAKDVRGCVLHGRFAGSTSETAHLAAAGLC